MYACELCNKTCQNQLKFFEHLKSHYEPGLSPKDVNCEVTETIEQLQHFDEVEELHQVIINIMKSL